MLYCAYTCDYVFFSGFSQASRNFLANFREGARKSLNRAENRGGLGTIRDDLGSYSKVLKTVCPKGTGVRIPHPPPKNSTSFDLSNFFIHCESNGISSRRSRGYHHRRCISSAVGCIFFRNDDIQGFRLGDIQNFVLMIYTPLARLGRYSSNPNKN